MRNLVVWGMIYFVVGCIFIYFVVSLSGSMWLFYFILLMVFVVYNISIFFKMFVFLFKIKKN